jgi:hypothetical protein
LFLEIGPLTSILRYKYYFYKIDQIIKYDIINNTQIDIYGGWISMVIKDTFLYVTVEGFNEEKYRLHSSFNTMAKWPIDYVPGFYPDRNGYEKMPITELSR